jgi:zinc D-Ala-D-Ala carboxypeptidase
VFKLSINESFPKFYSARVNEIGHCCTIRVDNNPNANQIEKLKLLCENILQPVRDHFGPVTITSGFRSPALCVKIGSSVNSQHTQGCATDFECPGKDNAEVAD